MKTKDRELLDFLRRFSSLKKKVVFSALIKAGGQVLAYGSFYFLLKAVAESLIHQALAGRLFFLALLLGLGQILLGLWDSSYSHDLSYGIIQQVRDDVFQHYYAISPGGVAGLNQGDFIQMIVNDINVVEWFVAHILIEWLALGMVALLGLVLAFNLSLFTGAILLLALGWVSRQFLLTSSTRAEEGLVIKEAGGSLYAELVDGLEGAKELVSFDSEEDFYQRIRGRSQAYNDLVNHYQLARVKAQSKISLGLLGAALGLALTSPLSGLEYLLTLGLGLRFLGQVWSVLNQTSNYGFIFGAVKRLADVYAIEPLVEWKGRGQIKEEGREQGIEFLACDFSYPKNPDRQILKDLSFQVKPGEKTVLVSASGGGKSTIFHLINRFYDPDQGQIRVFGRNIKDYAEESLRQAITTVSQEVFFFEASLWENLTYAQPGLKPAQVEALAKKVNAWEFIQGKDQGLDTRVREGGENFSGGEIQRLGLLRALLKDAPILLLDESTSALDSKNEGTINQVLEDIKKDKVIFIIAHRIRTMEEADRILFLQGGRIEASGSYEDLLAGNEDFRDLIQKVRQEEEEGEGVD